MNTIGKCGDNCECCPRYLATQTGDISELERIKKLWVRLGLRDPTFPAERMICHGCATENRCAYAELMECVNSKELDNCGLCDDYPCDRIELAFAKSDSLKKHAETVCTAEEFEMLHNAFFSKKDYFDHIHAKHRKNSDSGD